MNQFRRCDWVSDNALYQEYHDNVWGRPVVNEQELFAKLCLDGQQAGLSWLTVLKKQRAYYQLFEEFSPEKIALFNQEKINFLLEQKAIIRNRLKIESIIKNAKAFLSLKDKGIDFCHFLWGFVDGIPKQNNLEDFGSLPSTSKESVKMSKTLKMYGFSFVGPTICYAFMQAVGMVNDHMVYCHCHQDCASLGKSFSVLD